MDIEELKELILSWQSVIEDERSCNDDEREEIEADAQQIISALSQLQAENAELRRELENEKIECATFRHGHRVASDNCVRLERELEEARKQYQWLLHNGGLLNEFAKTWNPAKITLIAHLEAEIKAARQQQG